MGKNVNDYCMVVKSSTKAFEDEVKQRLKQGWTIYGNPSVVWAVENGLPVVIFCQAMIKS